MGLGGLFEAGLVEWMSRHDVSGGLRCRRAEHARAAQADGRDPGWRRPIYWPIRPVAILDIDRRVADALRSGPTRPKNFGVPLAGSLIPWIDKDLGERPKPGGVEGPEPRPTRSSGASDEAAIPVDGICVRIGAMRCHSQALTIKLHQRRAGRRNRRACSAEANPWVKLVPNNARSVSMQGAEPGQGHRHPQRPDRPSAQTDHGLAATSAFTVGDQLLWGRPNRCVACCGSCWSVDRLK